MTSIPQQFYAGCSTPDEAKNRWKELSLKHYPDRPGGDLQTMQEINRQYLAYQKNNNDNYTMRASEMDFMELYKILEKSILRFNISLFVKSFRTPEILDILAGLKTRNFAKNESTHTANILRNLIKNS